MFQERSKIPSRAACRNAAIASSSSMFARLAKSMTLIRQREWSGPSRTSASIAATAPGSADCRNTEKRALSRSWPQCRTKWRDGQPGQIASPRQTTITFWSVYLGQHRYHDRPPAAFPGFVRVLRVAFLLTALIRKRRREIRDGIAKLRAGPALARTRVRAAMSKGSSRSSGDRFEGEFVKALGTPAPSISPPMRSIPTAAPPPVRGKRGPAATGQDAGREISRPVLEARSGRPLRRRRRERCNGALHLAAGHR